MTLLIVRTWRIAWTIASLTAVQTAICAISMMPVIWIWSYLAAIPPSRPATRLIAFSSAIVPSYVLFALCLMTVSPLAIRLLGWNTPPDRDLRIADLEWPLLRWVRYAASLHVTRVLAGTFFRGSPMWTTHLRLNGARLGKRVYINSLGVSDYNLFECGDDCVIGGSVHLSGHTVEAGVLKTAAVRLGPGVTVGLGSVVEIGVEVGANAQIGALSFVPKHTHLAGGGIYAGIPVTRLS
jgi:acetyltransferase-like isoleucine patch superfamily enzyme